MIVILLGVVALIAIMATLQAVQNKRHPRRSARSANIALMGGTICPKCKRPFSRHIWGLNAGLPAGRPL